MSGWNRELATIWTNNVAPSRPSHSEMFVYTQYLRQLQKKSNKPIKLLVLGSTPEFRDWGYDENLIVHVVDKSEEYYETVSREIRHKNLQEHLHISSWEEMSFDEQFDIIIGDLSIGNIEPNKFDDFLINIEKALAPGGLFMGKSFIWREDEPVKSPRQIVDEYNSSIHIHPYTFINHHLGLYCLDKTSFLIDFSKMYQELSDLHRIGYIGDELFSFFTNIGWNTEMKFKFFSPSQEFFQRKVNEHLSFVAFEHTMDIYTNVFPIYIAQKRKTEVTK